MKLNTCLWILSGFVVYSVLHFWLQECILCEQMPSFFSTVAVSLSFLGLLDSLVPDPVLLSVSSTVPCMNCAKSLPAWILQRAAHGQIYTSNRPLSISYSHLPSTVHSVQTSRNTWPRSRLSTESSNMLTASSVAVGLNVFITSINVLQFRQGINSQAAHDLFLVFLSGVLPWLFCDIQKLFIVFASF